MTVTPAPLVFALSESRALGEAVAREARLSLAPLEDIAFPEGEFRLRPLTSVRDRTVFVVQSLAGSADAPIAHRLLRLLFLLSALHDAEAEKTIALVPYLSFSRQDQRTQPRDAINTRYVAQLLESTGLNRFVALDAHNSAALDNAYRIPVDHLSAIPMFVDHFASQGISADLTVVSPDIGGVKRVQVFKELLERRLGHGVELAFVEKRRSAGAVSGGRIIGQVNGRQAIVLDDLCASGETLLRAAAALRDAGARSIHVACTHTPMATGLEALVASTAIAGIVITDSVGRDPGWQTPASRNSLCVLSIAPLFGQAVSRMASGASLETLLSRWPPEPDL